MYARIVQGRVADLFTEMPELSQAACEMIVACDNGADMSWVWDGANGVRPKNIDETLAELSQKCNAKRELVGHAMLYALAVNGAGMDATMGDLRTKWQTIADNEADETMNILLAGG